MATNTHNSVVRNEIGKMRDISRPIGGRNGMTLPHSPNADLTGWFPAPGRKLGKTSPRLSSPSSRAVEAIPATIHLEREPRTTRLLAATLVSSAWEVPRLTLLVVPDGDLARAPRLHRTHQDRRGERRPDEHQLLRQNTLDRAKGAKQGEQKRNRKDGRHCRDPFGDKLARLIACAVRNAGQVTPFPRRAQQPKKIYVTYDRGA
jgi:hypothetical protein